MASFKSVIVLLAVVAVAAATEDAVRDRRQVLLSGVAPLPIARAGIVSPLVPGLTSIGHGLAVPAVAAPWGHGLAAPAVTSWGHGLAAPAVAAPWGHGLVNPWGGLVI